MKLINTPYAVGLLLCVTACADIDEGNETAKGGLPGHQTTLTVTPSAYTPLEATRTAVTGMDEDGSLILGWTAGDGIGVFGDEKANVPFTNSESDANAFTGDFDDVPRYAYYPYSKDAADPTAVAVEIPAEQMYADERSIAQYDIKAAAVTQSGGGYSLDFRQMAALVRFEIDLSGVADLADDELLLSMDIRPTDSGETPMTGRFTYDLTRLGAGLRPGGDTDKGITLRFALPPTAREKATAYAVVAPGSHKSEEWTCTFATDRQQGTFTTQCLCDFEAGKYYTVPLNADVLANNHARYEELPEEETANCYIVTAPGEYDFKATVIGNGPKGIIKGAGFHTENPYINPKSAGLLWSESADFITSVKLENGRVHYTVGDAYSNNAVIAVYSEPGCKGDILWSWHIWGTIGTPADEEYTNQAGAKFEVMDRELGAVRAAQYGTLYQWGRKDPFPHSATTGYWDGTETVKINTNFGWPTVAIDDATIKDGIQHPMELVHGLSATQQNWLGADNHYLWGDANRELPESLNDPKAGAGWEQQKTIYDPSPVGYRVANIFTFSGFTKCASGTNAGIKSQKLSYLNYVKAVTGTNVWYFKRNADDIKGVPYQAIKSRDGFYGYKKKNAGYGGYWWAAEAYTGDDGEAYACYLNTDQYRQGADSYNEIDTYGRGYRLLDAYAVRCVREK